jgi:hypothetical protein
MMIYREGHGSGIGRRRRINDSRISPLSHGIGADRAAGKASEESPEVLIRRTRTWTADDCGSVMCTRGASVSESTLASIVRKYEE